MTTVVPTVGNAFGFAKLSFPDGRDCYLQKYEVSLGRKSNKHEADINLGNQMNISRHHAVIRYNFEKAGFEMQVFGKNGATINGKSVTPDDEPCPLKSKAVVQIGEAAFYFLLPADKHDNNNNDHNHTNNDNNNNNNNDVVKMEEDGGEADNE